jgi:hypothetical protein
VGGGYRDLVARTNDFPRVLWLVTSAWLAGCGRLGFGALQDDPGKPLADGPVAGPDAAATSGDAAPPSADATPMVDAAPIVDTAPITDSIAAGAPGFSFDIPPITTTCGAGATTVPATVSNPGTADLLITSITPASGDPFQVAQDMFPIKLRPSESATIQITALPAVLGTDRGGAVKSGTLLIVANVPTTSVPVSTTIMGANIDVTLPQPPPPLLDFEGSSGSCPAPQPARIQNTGNLPATVSVQVLGPFAMAGSSGATLAINGVMTRNFRPSTGSACMGAGVIEYQVTAGATCNSGAIVASVDAQFNISGASSTCFCS